MENGISKEIAAVDAVMTEIGAKRAHARLNPSGGNWTNGRAAKALLRAKMLLQAAAHLVDHVPDLDRPDEAITPKKANKGKN